MRRAGAMRAAVAAMALAGCSVGPTPTPTPPCPTAAPSAGEAGDITAGIGRAVLTTNKGEFAIDLERDASPVAVANFVVLARCGFYDGVTFHRVIPGFVIQAGDPQTKDNHGDFQTLGTGGPGYRFEIEMPPSDTTYEPYTVAMANALNYDPSTGEILGGTDTNGSQFFVVVGDARGLPPYYSVLGRVGTGTDVVDSIGEVPTNARDVPLDPVVIESIRIETTGAQEPS